MAKKNAAKKKVNKKKTNKGMLPTDVALPPNFRSTPFN